MSVAVPDLQPRKDAAKCLGRAMRDPRVQKELRKNGAEPSDSVLVCLESDTVESVVGRARSYDPPVMLAVYWPDRQRLAIGVLAPGSSESAASTGAPTVAVHHSATIGMLIESGNAMIRPSEWDRALVVSQLATC